MVVNLYLSAGQVIASHVDESTKHRRGDALSLNGIRYVVTDIQEMEHLDYLTIIRINTLVEKPPEIDIDEGGLDNVFSGQIPTNK
ncbi:MAG: hypothetical protein NC548_40635 [Lachnospiraceae bacterium]|nr:hypothetical protein [Lachnospiraceae bacterium]